MAHHLSKFAKEEGDQKPSGSTLDQRQDISTSPRRLKLYGGSRCQTPQSPHRNIFVPHSDAEFNLKLLNGQMRLSIADWKSGVPKFLMKNHVLGKPKGGLEVGFHDETINIEFRIPPGFPDGMIGFMTILQYIFLEPECLGILDIKIGSDPVKAESRKAKEQKGKVGWSSPWDSSGCRVSWIKENEDSVMKYKFSNINKIGVDEEMIVTMDECNELYGKIGSADPNTYGKWLAMPARIWLRTQWFMRNVQDIDNGIFSKLTKSTAPVEEMQPTSKRKGKKKKTKSRRSLGPANPSSTPTSDQKPPTNAPSNMQAVAKSTPSLTVQTASVSIDMIESKHSIGAHKEGEKPEHAKIASQNGQIDMRMGSSDEGTPTEQHSVQCSGQSSSPAYFHSPTLTPAHPESPADATRTCISPIISRNPSTPCSFSTATDIWPQSIPGEIDTEEMEEIEIELATPIAGAEGYSSGLFEGLQKVVSPTKQKSRALPTPATENAQLATEEDCAGATQCSDEPLDESSRISETKLAKNKKDRIRRKKRAAATSTRGFMECYSTTYPGFSLVHGWKTNSSSSSETLEEESPTPTQKGEDSINLTEGQWNVFEIPLPCSREGCPNQCSFMDGSTVICPACGPFSLVRYCGKQHLWEDVLDHWIRCRCYPLLHKFGISSIPKEIFMGPPILHNFHQWDRPERHRQAVWFSSAASYGDYFVFMNNDYPPNSVYQSVGSEGPVYPMGANVACWFKEPQEKDRIRRVLAVCLFLAPQHPAIVGYLYRLVRDWFISHGWLSESVHGALARQIGLETGLDPKLLINSELHACEAEWYGKNHPCSNPRCASDPPTMFPYPGLSGFKELCDILEGNFWLLRAHRTTHPGVGDMVDRIQGVGFDQARVSGRVWPRGEGWDGVGTGPMWVEEAWPLWPRFAAI
ncbi:unnamed protein product [Penicillium olsonii]|nr:unnamed protein product [Penicillium olsonii]